VARCGDGEQALEAVARLGPDVLLIELRTPGADGLEVLRRLASRRARTPVVLLADGLGEREAEEAMRLGVSGVILKEMMPASSLLRCLRAAQAGEPWVERRSAARLIEKLVRDESGRREATSVLTPRELEVVRMVGRGLRNRGIAEALGISESTVKAHLGSTYAKLGARGRLDLFRFAADRGLT